MELLLQYSWFVQIRWAFLAAELLVVIIAAFLFPINFPTATLLTLLCMTALSNALLQYGKRFAANIYNAVVPATICFDIAMLALSLALTGGNANPFCSLFLIHITLSAVLLDTKHMWASLALCSLAYGALFFAPLTLPEISLHPHHGGVSIHLVGMLLSFLLTAVIIGIFLARLTNQLSLLRQRSQNLAQMAAVGHLAANTAHELASPLNTVALALENLCSSDSLSAQAPDAREDLQLAESELGKAMGILKSMPQRAGITPGEVPIKFQLSDLNQKIIGFGATASTLEGEVCLPFNGLSGAIANLVRNAIQAQAKRVDVTSILKNGRITIKICDDGIGLPPSFQETQNFAPFSHSQENSAGLGLGLFIVSSFAGDLGGSFKIASKTGAISTEAVLNLPQFVV